MTKINFNGKPVQFVATALRAGRRVQFRSSWGMRDLLHLERVGGFRNGVYAADGNLIATDSYGVRYEVDEKHVFVGDVETKSLSA